MPQLDPEFFVSQLFWLVVTFSFLLLFLWKVSLPRIGSVLEKRENKINNDIETAKQLQIEAEKIKDQIDQKLYDSKEKNISLIKNSTVNLQNKASEELSKLDNELNKKIEKSAKVIGAGLAVIGVIGSGIGIGNIFSSFIEAVGRNPAARGEVFTMTMLGFALVEAIALFALVIALVILFG